MTRACLVIALAAASGFGQAQSPPCIHVATVESVGFAPADAQGASGLNGAVLEALANAVARERGVFVDVETRLAESFRSVVTNGELRQSDLVTFERVITERAGGFIVGYEVLDSATDEQTTSARLRVLVCTDARLTLHWIGPNAGQSAFEGRLRATLATAGWQIVERGAGPPLRLVDALGLGATHRVSITVSSRASGPYRGLETHDVSFDLLVEDLLGRSVSTGLRRTVQAVGRSAADAQSIAANQVAADLANAILRSVAKASGEVAGPPGSLVLQGARRPNTALEVAAIVERIGGVTRVSIGPSGDGFADLIVDTQRDMCEIARELLASRRLLLRVDSCDAGSAVLTVLRE